VVDFCRQQAAAICTTLIPGVPNHQRQKSVALVIEWPRRTDLAAVEGENGTCPRCAIASRNPLERCFRDVEVLRHHAFGAEGRYETAGRIFLGLAPDFVALAL